MELRSIRGYIDGTIVRKILWTDQQCVGGVKKTKKLENFTRELSGGKWNKIFVMKRFTILDQEITKRMVGWLGKGLAPIREYSWTGAFFYPAAIGKILKYIMT